MRSSLRSDGRGSYAAAPLAILACTALYAGSAEARNPTVELTTSMGVIQLELFKDKAPKTVENFLKYVKGGHYSGTIFHRVISDFMIQGGGFDASYKQKPTRGAIQNEADNGLKNERGTAAMARTSDPHSATAQFFINVKDNAFLNHREKSDDGWGYCVFGKVKKGMDVVDRIKAVPTGAKGTFSKDAPQKEVLIKKARAL
jgi:peptidyl-prolyl cis-trans isomerase A (cyclophilin A)/peptidyl-prolyl cis-trans isomerase B (cyclophilin B)